MLRGIETMYIQGMTKDEMCRPFSLTLEGQARAWYQKLKQQSIRSFS